MSVRKIDTQVPAGGSSSIEPALGVDPAAWDRVRDYRAARRHHLSTARHGDQHARHGDIGVAERVKRDGASPDFPHTMLQRHRLRSRCARGKREFTLLKVIKSAILAAKYLKSGECRIKGLTIGGSRR
jgi:hypothetical protein